VALEHPAAALDERGGELGQEGESVSVEVAEQIEDLGGGCGRKRSKADYSGICEVRVHLIYRFPVSGFAAVASLGSSSDG